MSAIAIVGMGCRFAGAPDLQSFWRMSLEGRHAFTPVPANRWDEAVFFDANARAIDKSYAPTGAFVEDITSFPALALGLPPRRVEVMDPQQRFVIEAALAAIEDAGTDSGAMPRRTGVFVGVTATEFRPLLNARVMVQLLATGHYGRVPDDVAAFAESVENIVPSRPYSAPGALGNMCAATVAQELDLHGPAYTVDAACASALIGVADAVTQLRAGMIDAALAGGVYLQISPDHYVGFSRIGAMSKSGVCRPFDARADGFVQGDGAGMVLLKRLADAQRDGDRIYAVIEGVAVNNDGRGDGPMAPLASGQASVILDAWRDSGVDPSRLGYVETHGTGTDVGDATELRGLMQSVGAGVRRAALGSSKANVGHTMSAAGVAGLIRAVLALHHGVVPPMANFEASKPEVGLDATPFYVPTVPVAWADEGRVACVSSFGFGGTNAHTVLSAGTAPSSADAQAEIVLMSASSEAALQDLARRTATALRDDPRATVAGVARAWAVRRPQPARLAIVAASLDELITRLDEAADGVLHAGIRMGTAAPGKPSVAFLFPGQGAQRCGMLADARARFPVIADTLAELESGLNGVLDRPLTHLIYPNLRGEPVDAEAAEAELTDTANCQPAMLATGVALTRLLASVGVTPTVVTGHSLGEFTAAAAGGVIDAVDAACFVARRGQAMAALPGDHGAMAAVMADRDTVAQLLVDGAVVANVNHPRQLVVSGTAEAVDEVVRRAEAAEIKATRLQVSHAFHSPVLAGLDTDGLVDGLSLHAPTITVASGIASAPYADAADARGVFARHAVSPVDFVGALQQCVDAGADLFVQVGAGGPLASFARGSLPNGHRGVVSVAGLDDHDGGRGVLDGLGQLWVAGVNLDTDALCAAAVIASVPPSVLPREVYWPVKEQAQRGLVIQGTSARPEARAAAAPQPQAAQEPPPEAGDDVLNRVIAVVAKVSAYPRDALRPEMALVEDLGFDSLMVGDLATGLADAFPGLGGIPQELLINRPTVIGIVDHVRSSLEGGPAVEVDDDAPLRGWTVGWRPTPLPDLPERDVAGRSAVVVGDGPLAHAAAAALGAAGHASRRVAVGDDLGTADLVVWCAEDAPVPVGAVSRGEQPWPDLAGPLLAALAATGAEPDLLVVRRAADPWAQALAGAARALAREWPGSVVKCVAVDGPLDDPGLAPRLVAEWRSADVSTDVRWREGERSVAALIPQEPTAGHAFGAGDTVLVTGGTRGIGARLAQRLHASGCTVLVVGRGDPEPSLAALGERIVHVRADVTHRDALRAAVAPHGPIHAVVHSAGVLADGPLSEVDPSRGSAAREVKALGWLYALDAAGPDCRAAVGIGSWAGRFGNRHQAHYAAANALLAGLVEASEGVRATVGEFGPWTSSDMAQTIPAPIRQAMRAEGVDFVGDEAGLAALLDDLARGTGAVVHGRDLPDTQRAVEVRERLSVATHPFLVDHAIDGVPVLPLASATDLVAWAAGLEPPFAIDDLRLFQGITVREPVDVVVRVRGDRAEIRIGEREALAYRARIRRGGDVADAPPLTGGDAPKLDLDTFYRDITFHGPLLRGVTGVDGLTDDMVRGRVRGGVPADWEPGTARRAWSVDPLALDSAFQLAGYLAYSRYGRLGTPTGLGRITVLGPLPAGEMTVELVRTAQEGDRFTGDVRLRDANGRLLLVAEDVVAELRAVEGIEEPIQIDPKLSDPSQWKEVKDLEMRLQITAATGIQNPYFKVHEGTARDTTQMGGREYVHYSGYNYLGLSGDPRVLDRVADAVRTYGTSVSASRVASGERPFHGELERLLAECQDTDDALVFTAGHATNVTTIGHLMKPEDLILHDELIHDSALQGMKLAGSARRSFRHDDPAHLEEELKKLRKHYKKCLIVVEGVYSMDGDICNLPAYVALKKKYGCLLMVDEAHSFGVIGATGCGIREHFGIPGRDIDIWMGTLSKSLASCGGWIAGSKPLVQYLRYTAPGFVYSAGLTAANGVAALASLELMLEEPWRVLALQHNAKVFHDALLARDIDTGPAHGESGVIPAVTGNSMHALMLSQRLLDKGVNVQPIIYPAVADDAARLRFFLSSTHTEEQLRSTANAVADVLDSVRADFPLPGAKKAAR